MRSPHTKYKDEGGRMKVKAEVTLESGMRVFAQLRFALHPSAFILDLPTRPSFIKIMRSAKLVASS